MTSRENIQSGQIAYLYGVINSGAIPVYPPANDIVTITGNQTITGDKVFTGTVNAPTVDVLDDSTSVATTEWVKDYVPLITGGFVTASANNNFTGINSFVNPITPSITTFDGIDMSGNDIIQVDNIDLVTINGSAYPPVVIDPSLNTVLTAGNTATNSIILNNGATHTITTDPSLNTIVITDGTTTNTINQSGYTTRNSVQNLTHFLNFSDASTTGVGAIQKTSGIECNPSTKTITATTFVGDLSGNATSATTASGATDITITDSTATAGTFYPTFVNSAGTNKSVRIDTTGLTYSPSTDTLTTTNFAGTATHATDITITDSTATAGTFYPTFVNTAGTQKSVRVDTTGLTYSPSTDTLTTTNFAGTATTATNIAGGLGGSIPYQSAVNTTALLANGTAGQLLQSNGTTLAPSWVTPAGASTIAVTDTNTIGTYFPTFVSGSGAGQTLRADTTITPLTYNINNSQNNNDLKISQATAGTNQSFFLTSINTALGSGTDRYSQLQLYTGNNATGKTSSQLYAQLDNQNFSNCNVRQDSVNLYHTFVDAETTYTSGIQTYDDVTYNVPVSVLYANLSAPTDNFAGIRCRTQPNQSVEMFSGTTIDVATNIASFNSSAISLIPAVSFTQQLTLPTTRPTATFATGVLTCNFGSLSTGIFTGVLTANMTGATFSGGRIGGQYVIYLTATGGTRTIATALTNTTINKTNYTTAISVLTTSFAVLTITFDGTRYLIAGSAYN